MDASGMVKMAQRWKNVGPQVQSAVKASIGQVSIPASSSRTAKMEVTDHGDVNFLEHVQAHVSVEAPRRGDISMYLTSPHGTKSQLLARRPHDSSRAGFHDWPFLTVLLGREPSRYLGAGDTERGEISSNSLLLVHHLPRHPGRPGQGGHARLLSASSSLAFSLARPISVSCSSSRVPDALPSP